MKLEDYIQTNGEYIRTKSGIWLVKIHFDGARYFECTVDGVSFTVFEDSQYWKDNKKCISKNIEELTDVLVVASPGNTPEAVSPEKLKDESYLDQCIKNIREKGYHYYLSVWDDSCNLKKFAELTTKGIQYLFC